MTDQSFSQVLLLSTMWGVCVFKTLLHSGGNVHFIFSKAKAKHIQQICDIQELLQTNVCLSDN